MRNPPQTTKPALAALLVAAMGACAGPAESTGTSATTESTESVGPRAEAAPGGRLVDGYYVTDDSPPPRACETDAECVASGVLAADGCCWSYRHANLVPQSADYRDWTSARRASCDTAACGPPPTPTRPDDCLFEVSCAEGRCVNACDYGN